MSPQFDEATFNLWKKVVTKLSTTSWSLFLPERTILRRLNSFINPQDTDACRCVPDGRNNMDADFSHLIPMGFRISGIDLHRRRYTS